MRKLGAWLLRLGKSLHKGWSEEELSTELESHLQLHIEDNLRAGMTGMRRDAMRC
jgi:macrolide transport system ATP-binding/permease protein